MDNACRLLSQSFLARLTSTLLQIVLLFLDAIQRNRRTASVTDDEVQSRVVSYLHGSKDREGGKTARLKAKRIASAENNDE